MSKLSESEEMYLVTIAKRVELGSEEPVTISQLAEELSIQPVSANQMVRKLADEGYVHYLPYKGVELLPEGRRLAHRVLRRRRLWELFLVKHLDLPPIEADTLACRLEHITPADVAERLYQFLEQPSVSSQGFPIPSDDEEGVIDPLQPLNQLSVDQLAKVIRLETDSPTTAFLEAEGIQPGATVSVQAIGEQGALLLQNDQCRVTITGDIAAKVLVKERSEATAIAD